MAVEGDFYRYNSGEKELEFEDVVYRGHHKKYAESPGLVVFVNYENTRSVYKLGSISNIYAIRFLDEEDEEGEIVDLSNKNIELRVGNELCIREISDKHLVREVWFEHTHDEDYSDNELNDLQIPSLEPTGKY